MRGRRSLVALATLAAVGCLRMPATAPSFEPQANFAAYVDGHRIVVKRLPGGNAGVVEPPALSLGTPRFTLEEDGRSVAELRLTAPATVGVHATAPDAPAVAGAVQPSWDDNAIRLRLESPTAERFQTDTFRRVGGGTGYDELTRAVQNNLDVRGTYRAVVRDAKGTDVGWVRVRISPYQDAPRVYDGVLPADVSPGVAAAIPVALNSEIDWIENHTVDVYRGVTGGGLQQSVPLGK